MIRRCRPGRRDRAVAADRHGGRCLGDPGPHHPGGGGEGAAGASGETAARETGGAERVAAPAVSLAKFSADRRD